MGTPAAPRRMMADSAASPITAPNLASLLLEHPFEDRMPLLHGPGRDASAGMARREVRDVAERLREAGVGARHAVAVQLPDGVDAIVAMVAIWSLGAVFVPVSARASDAEVENILNTTRPSVLVTAEGVRNLENAETYDDGVAFVMWTSGTTGRPKAILHTHDAYLELIDRVLAPIVAKRTASSDPPPPNLIPVPLAQNAGIYNVLFGLRAGAAIVVMGPFDTERFAHLVREFAITSTVLPPAAITMLADDTSLHELTPLRYVRSITAPLSPLSARRFMDRFGVVVLNGYGQAELGEVIGWTAAQAREFPHKLGAVGRPHKGVELRILDDDAGIVTDGEPGELAVRPPRRALGIVGGGDLDDRVDDDGFVRTGDIARIDDDGFVWIEGRKGDVINRGGNKVFPEQVEEVLRLHDGVEDAVVVSAPDRRLGEVPVAFVVGRWNADELTRLCRDHLTAYKVPVAFVAIDAVPRSAAGKVARAELAEHAAQAVS